MNQQHPELFRRHKLNPILTAADWPYPVHTVFNPAATLLPDGTHFAPVPGRGPPWDFPFMCGPLSQWRG